jgi:hypothetical protein
MHTRFANTELDGVAETVQSGVLRLKYTGNGRDTSIAGGDSDAAA